MMPVQSPLTRSGSAIAVAIATLCLVGLACVYASERAGGGWCVNTIKQALFTVVGVGLGWILLGIGYQRIARHAYLLFGLGLLLLIPLLIAKLTGFEFGGLVPGRRGAHRWISLPAFQIQPSEFVKIAYVLALAQYLRFRKNYRTLAGLSVPIILSVVPMALILSEPDLGTVLLMIPVLFSLLFAAGARKRHLALFAGLAVAAAPLLWTRIADYQRLRITGLLLQSETFRDAVIDNPDAYAHLCSKRQALQWERDLGWQLTCSKAALGSGGLIGQGWGRGVYVEHNLLPDRHNDFVFALVGQQWGLAGCLVVLASYAVLILAAAEIAAATTEPFGRLLAVGIMSLFATQVVINVGMTAGLMPITGMTLPFVSYGGSSLLSSFLGAALLISVSLHRPFMLSERPFEYARSSRRPPSPAHPRGARHGGSAGAGPGGPSSDKQE
ncbi:MAG: FtsW/RodA/SpoVE family cell cycle protein [bacterium]|nr:FtsW/RodA/SpoVE family cell cycle protein [bacterium]